MKTSESPPHPLRSMSGFPWRRGSSPLRGDALARITLPTAAWSIVGMVVLGALGEGGVTAKSLIDKGRSRAARMRVMDQIRYRLVEARIGTPAVSDSNHRLEFQDPNLETTSAFQFVTATRELLYDRDVSRKESGENPMFGGVKVADVPFDLIFSIRKSGALIAVRMGASVGSGIGEGDGPSGETLVYLRNI